MRINKLLPAIVAFVFVTISSVPDANAYFTTYVTAKGGYDVNWKHEEKIDERFEDWNKYVSVTSKEGSVPVFVRVKAFAGSLYSLQYSGNDWSYNEKDGFYYYNKALKGGETTSNLKIFIGNIPAKPQQGDNFNVTVVYETVPVQYDDEGNPLSPMAADWGQDVTTGKESADGQN